MPQTFARPSPAATAAARAVLNRTSTLDTVGTSRRSVVKAFVPTVLPSLLAVNGKTQYRPFNNPWGIPSYLEAYVPTHPNAEQRSGWVAVHRIVAENALGRALNKGEQVRFIDGNGFNVSPRNLSVGGVAVAR